jgi:hypothetical protein
MYGKYIKQIVVRSKLVYQYILLNTKQLIWKDVHVVQVSGLTQQHETVT